MLEAGATASLSVADHEGKTPLGYATDPAIQALLRNWGSAFGGAVAMPASMPPVIVVPSPPAAKGTEGDQP